MSESASTSISVRKPFEWDVFLLLLGMNIAASVLIVPYAESLQQSAGGIQGSGQAAIPWLEVVAAQAVSGLCVNGPLLAAGLFIAQWIDLGAPALAGLLHRQPIEHLRRRLLAGLGVGLAIGAILLGLIHLTQPIVNAELARMGIPLLEGASPPAWQGLLAAISAGITEETLLRLFGLSLVAWIGRWLTGRREGRPSAAILWIANVIVALAFGALHLPTASSLAPLTPVIVTQVMALNGLAGLGFGWLYWRFGLESAMLAHFSTDVVIHVLAAALQIP